MVFLGSVTVNNKTNLNNYYIPFVNASSSSEKITPGVPVVYDFK